MGFEPLNNGVLELAESHYDGYVAFAADVFDILDAGRQTGDRREGENKGLDRRVG